MRGSRPRAWMKRTVWTGCNTSSHGCGRALPACDGCGGEAEATDVGNLDRSGDGDERDMRTLLQALLSTLDCHAWLGSRLCFCAPLQGMSVPGLHAAPAPHAGAVRPQVMRPRASC